MGFTGGCCGGVGVSWCWRCSWCLGEPLAAPIPKATVTMDANSDEYVKNPRQNKVVTLYAFSDILIVITFLPCSKDGRT